MLFECDIFLHLSVLILGNLSQGIPFFHAGDEMLRSKSIDRDSYNSGDWFNRSTTSPYDLPTTFDDLES